MKVTLSDKNVEERLMDMFTELHGDYSTGSCSPEIVRENGEEYGEPIGIEVMKNGNSCGFYSKTDILFDYITGDWSK